MWILAAAGGPLLALTGCLKERDRVGRGGGSISVFLGEGGLLIVEGWTGDRLPGGLPGEGGANDGAELFDEGIVIFAEGIFNAPGRMIL